MLKKYVVFLFIVSALSHFIYPHCQVPCGIYHDPMRISMMEEDLETITKAMQEIKAHSKETQDPQTLNQLVRWINEKERSCGNIQTNASAYFLTQRVKPAKKESAEYSKYVAQTTSLQQIIFYAMKCKQSVDENNLTSLKDAITHFQKAYFNP